MRSIILTVLLAGFAGTACAADAPATYQTTTPAASVGWHAWAGSVAGNGSPADEAAAYQPPVPYGQPGELGWDAWAGHVTGNGIVRQ